MENVGISINSAYKEIGLNAHVHGKTGSRRYIEAVSNRIRMYDNPAELVEFLEDTARQLHDLNLYAGSPLLHSKFDEFLNSIEEISQ